MSQAYQTHSFSGGTYVPPPPVISLRECAACGALVIDQQVHDEWHEKLQLSENEFWRSVAQKAITDG